MTDTRKNIGDILLDEGIITSSQLRQAVDRQKQMGGKLGQNFIDLGVIGEGTLLKYLARQFNIPCVDLTKIKLDPEKFPHLSPEMGKKYEVMPLEEREHGGRKYLFLAMIEPENMLAIEEIEFLTGYTIKPVIATDAQITSAVSKYFNGDNWVEIPPLKEKVETVHPRDIERMHDDSQIERMETDKRAGPMEKNVEMLAMFRLLLKKGVFTKDEFLREVKHLKDWKK
ncbi:MAG: hypothetical protein OEV42_13665 [Deltaproteobacteria bacterium]|nr:hypothetical protein [Deltaproteobacteria bacterium]